MPLSLCFRSEDAAGSILWRRPEQKFGELRSGGQQAVLMALFQFGRDAQQRTALRYIDA
jgi:hypothetical protein